MGLGVFCGLSGARAYGLESKVETHMVRVYTFGIGPNGWS